LELQVDIQEAFAEAATDVNELIDPQDSIWLEDELAMEFFTGVPEGGDVSDAMKTMARVAFAAGRVYQGQFQSNTVSVEMDGETVSAFLNFMINNRTGE
jgi:hypothetical protein